MIDNGKSDPIQVWRFGEAPADLQALSTNGGDEDWLALVPNSYRVEEIFWMSSGGPFGCCSVDKYAHPFDSRLIVVIGSHA